MMLTLDLKEIRENVGPAVEYLRSRLDEPFKIKGGKIVLTHTSARSAKFLLRKFLHQNQLEGYRVVSVNSGLIQVRATEKEKQRPVRAIEVDKPSVWETVPDQWYLTPPGIVRPGKRSKRETKRTMRGL